MFDAVEHPSMLRRWFAGLVLIGRERERRENEAVDFAPVTNSEHEDEEHIVLDCVDDSVLAHAPDVVLAGELFGFVRARALSERQELLDDALLYRARESFEVALSGLLEADAVALWRIGLVQSPSSSRTFSSETLPGSLSAFIAALTSRRSSSSAISRSKSMKSCVEIRTPSVFFPLRMRTGCPGASWARTPRGRSILEVLAAARLIR